MSRFQVLTLLAAPFVLTACISIQQGERVEVTPGTVPPEIRGATWPEVPISYCTVRDDEGGFVDYETFVEMTQQAIAAWGVPTSYSGDCGHSIMHGNGTNEIGWGTIEGSPNSLSEAGNTNIRYRSTTGSQPPNIIEADITIARQPAEGRETSECLYTTLLHETGHLFGVQHLEEGAVMSPVIRDCAQELTAADRDAINELYGD